MHEETEYQYVLIDEEVKEQFASVLPEELVEEKNRISIGIVDETDTILGAISYALVRFEYEIDWVYVRPSVRRRGVGTHLLQKALETVVATGDLFPITARFPYTPEEHAVFSLFQSNGEMEISYLYERFLIRPEEIRLSDHLHLHLNLKSMPFFDLPKNRQKAILKEMEEKHGYVIDSYESWKKGMVPAFCQCIFAEDELADLVLVQKLLNGNLEISFAYSKNGKGLIAIFASITAEAEKQFPHAVLTFDAVNEKARKLAVKLFPDARSVPIHEAVYL